VAEEEDFAPLRDLLQPVAGRPVNQLGEELRAWLKVEATKSGQLPVALALIDACDARAGEIERKRAHVSSKEESQGE
jgi:spore coat protein CotH